MVSSWIRLEVRTITGLPWSSREKKLRAIAWILGLVVTSFAMSGWCAGVLRMGRGAVVAVYVAVVGMLLLAYVRFSGIPLAGFLTQRWRTGLIAGLAVGALLAMMAQPGSPQPSGLHLAWALLWLGVDALLWGRGGGRRQYGFLALARWKCCS